MIISVMLPALEYCYESSGKIPQEIGECEHLLTDQTLENINGLQTYRS